MRRRLEVLAPVLLLLVLGTIQLLRDQPLWYDELYTAQVAPLSFPDLWHLVTSGTGPTPYLPDVPPSFNAPYYALMHLWLQLPFVGNGAVWLRLPSLLCAAAAAGVMTSVVRRIAGSPAGLVAGLLVASGPLLVEQSIEARSYGPAVLAVSLAALGLVRWLPTDGCGGRGLALFGVSACVAGLMHWFALPAVAGLVVGGLLLRRSWALALVGALSTVPTLALIAVASSHSGTGAPEPAAVGLRLPGYAINDWTVGVRPLVALTVVLSLVALRTRPVLLACWLAVPLVLVTAVELARPVYYPRYLLPALVALAALAAVGAASLPRRLGVVAAVVVVAVSLAADVPRLTRLPRERPDQVVAQLDAQQRPGEPIVAVDARAALDLDQYVRRDAPRLLPDIVLPPADAPRSAATDRVWLVRSTEPFQRGLPLFRFDDDDNLETAGFRVTEQTTYEGISGDLTVQRWER